MLLVFVLGGCLLLIYISSQLTFVSIKIPNSNCIPCPMWWLHFVRIPSVRPKENNSIKLWFNICNTQTMLREYSIKKQGNCEFEINVAYVIFKFVSIFIFNSYYSYIYVICLISAVICLSKLKIKVLWPMHVIQPSKYLQWLAIEINICLK